MAYQGDSPNHPDYSEHDDDEQLPEREPPADSDVTNWRDRVLPPDVTIEGDPQDQRVFFEKWAAAQADFNRVIKDSEGQIGNQRFKYANLATLREASLPALNKHGFALFQFITGAGRDQHLITTMVAGHGCKLTARVAFDVDNLQSTKDYGKVTTYIRRYAYQALTFLDGDTDADESGHVDYNRRQTPPAAPPRQQQRPAAQQQRQQPPPQRAQQAAPQAQQQPTGRPQRPNVTAATAKLIAECRDPITGAQKDQLRDLFVKARMGGMKAVQEYTERVTGVADVTALNTMQADLLADHLRYEIASRPEPQAHNG